jgi:DNA modification methylase
MEAKPPTKQLELSGLGSPVKYASLPLNLIVPDPSNARKHSRAQIRALSKSIAEFGFTAPLLVDKNRVIRAGHARFEAATLLGLTEVPVIFLDHLTELQAKAYAIADNALHDRSTWDDRKLAVQLKELSESDTNLDLEAIGFELPELDVRIQSLSVLEAVDRADEFNASKGAAFSMPGDIWQLGPHRLLCGNALEVDSFVVLMGDEKAAAIITDAPYNQRVDGHVSGKGRIKHREFAMASGELPPEEFAAFLAKSLKLMCDHAAAGAVAYCFMDWKHAGEMIAAGQSAGCDYIGLCVWIKHNGGMGSFYRSRHELIFVFRNGSQPHQNNIQLGKFGRNRQNAWFYPGVGGFRSKDAEDVLALHPTPKPIAMIADAILDSTTRGDIVLDPFLGSGTTLLAAERTGRRCYGIEIDPIYCDTIIARWEQMSGQQALNAQGQTFPQVKLERGTTP